MTAVRVSTVDEVTALVGSEIGVTDWHTVTQADVDQFAELTGDHQWIHVDQERARTSEFGQTIVHGAYTLALGSHWHDQLIDFSGFEFALNYGYDKVRFPVALPVGVRLRMRLTIASADSHRGGLLVCGREVFEAENVEKPVCVVDALSWLPVPAPGSSEVPA